MMKSLPYFFHAATQQSMRGRFTSLLVVLGLFFGVVIAPVIAHASDQSPVHAIELVGDLEIGDADHQHSQGSDKDMPCHAVSHHHCSIALHLDTLRISLNTLAKDALVRPGTATPLTSRSQAPPLDPPLA